MEAIDRRIHFLIVGGGTAGWMAACLMAERWRARNIDITVVESPEIGIIGVGEGSTPQLRAFFKQLGLSDEAWMPRCNASYKNGISFHGWSEAPGCESYFHPFPSVIDAHTTPGFHLNALLRRHGADVIAHPDRFFLSAKLSQLQCAPIPSENFPFDIAYGYHFDAYLVGQFLRNEAKARGVQHLERKVAGVELDAGGRITSLRTAEGEDLTADYFVDATGFRSLLLQEALKVPFVSFKSNLFNDSAVVFPTPHAGEGLSSATRSIAMRNGWRWEIPLTSRVGNGYVYSSAFCSADEAEHELREALGLLEDPIQARHLKMKVGRVDRHWERNCLAVGLSQGFIEPLEATALHLVQATVETFMQKLEEGSFSEAKQREFNQLINDRFEGVRDYIVCHYRMNRRTDTEYWRANARNKAMSNSLGSLLECWFTRGDIRQEVARQNIAKYYTDMSWTCMLAGYGQFPDELRAPTADESRVDMSVIDDFVTRCARNFRLHADVLKV